MVLTLYLFSQSSKTGLELKPYVALVSANDYPMLTLALLTIGLLATLYFFLYVFTSFSFAIPFLSWPYMFKSLLRFCDVDRLLSTILDVCCIWNAFNIGNLNVDVLKIIWTDTKLRTRKRTEVLRLNLFWHLLRRSSWALAASSWCFGLDLLSNCYNISRFFLFWVIHFVLWLSIFIF